MIYISIYMTHELAKTINFHLHNIYIISNITPTLVFSRFLFRSSILSQVRKTKIDIISITE